MRLRSIVGRMAGAVRPKDERLDRFDSWEGAAAASIGYDDPVIAEAVAARTERFKESLGGEPRPLDRQSGQDLLVVRSTPGAGISVLELGGACGALFFEIDARLPSRVTRWTIVETPSMVASARDRFASSRLNFVTTGDPWPQEPDLAIASGTLQYTPDPIETLRALVASQPGTIYVTRTPLTEEGEAFARQRSRLGEHGPGSDPSFDGDVSTPVAFVPVASIMDALVPHYETDMVIRESAPWQFGGLSVTYYGIVARRRA